MIVTLALLLTFTNEQGIYEHFENNILSDVIERIEPAVRIAEKITGAASENRVTKPTAGGLQLEITRYRNDSLAYLRHLVRTQANSIIRHSETSPIKGPMHWGVIAIERIQIRFSELVFNIRVFLLSNLVALSLSTILITGNRTRILHSLEASIIFHLSAVIGAALFLTQDFLYSLIFRKDILYAYPAILIGISMHLLRMRVAVA